MRASFPPRICCLSAPWKQAISGLQAIDGNSVVRAQFSEDKQLVVLGPVIVQILCMVRIGFNLTDVDQDMEQFTTVM